MLSSIAIRRSGITTTLAKGAARRTLSSSADSKRPMTRFIQYPFDKTKMEEVTAWSLEAKSTTMVAAVRATPGVSNVEVSFCPGEGWLAMRYIFDDLDDMKSFGDTDAFVKAKEHMMENPHYDSSREPHEFKGFFLKDV